MTMARDLYQEVTDRIVESLEKGVAPWVKPWNATRLGKAGQPRNGATLRRYSGINVIICYMSGFSSQDWFTYNQASKLGGQVRKGERATTLVFWKFLEDKKDPKKSIPLLRHFSVFNREQIDGLPALAPEEEAVVEPSVEEAQGRLAALGMRLSHGGDQAFYVPAMDRVQMPAPEDFVDTGAYLSTLYHEAAHWTGHESRLARDLSGRFGDESYAMEELVAEMGSAFLCEEFGVQGRLQHPEYIGHWIKKLQDDKRAIFRASTQAKKAAEFITASEEADEEVAA
jgi:antirestriction protein ArdC